MGSGQEERKQVIHLTDPKQNNPRKTYLHISAPKNFQYKSRRLMTENENVCKTIWKKNGNSNEYNEKCILCFFVIWNSKSAITYECGQVVLSSTSVYFVLSKFRLYLSTFIFTLCVPCFFFFLIDPNQKQALLIKWIMFVLVDGQPSVSSTYKLQQLKRKIVYIE